MAGELELTKVSLREGRLVGGGVRIHPENARMSGRHGVQYVAQCVACAALTPVVWQYITHLSEGRLAAGLKTREPGPRRQVATGVPNI